MENYQRINLSELPDILKHRNSTFFCCASFEDRSSSIPKAIKNLNFNNTIIFASDDCYDGIKNTSIEIKGLISGHSEIIATKAHIPIITADVMSKIIRHTINENVKDIIIDITTFTHEMLLILLNIVRMYADKFEKITCLYTSASDYSIGELNERKWLSKGCRVVRSVIGYPGILIPGRPTCLTVLVGFEHERATRMIEEMDPELLILGKGISSPEHLTHDSHKAPMEFFHNLVNNMESNRGSVENFEFSCRDPYLSSNTLNILIEQYNEYNHIIVPLNTKLSTIAVALSAWKKPEIQLCYAEPETYNFLSYSAPSDSVTIFDLRFD